MSYQKIYSQIGYKNFPSEDTPLNETNMGAMDRAIDEIDNRVVALDVAKVDLTKANELVKEILWDESNGTLTVVKMNGSKAVIDTKLEKLAVNFKYDPQTQQLVITLDDGTVQNVDLSALITQYEFSDSDEIAFEVTSDGKVKAKVKNGSITEEKLQPQFLADIKVNVSKAQTAAESASSSASAASSSAKEASKQAANATASATSASDSKDMAAQSLKDVESARDNALGQINDALGANTPQFTLNMDTGHLMWQGGRFNFSVNETTGRLGWEMI